MKNNRRNLFLALLASISLISCATSSSSSSEFSSTTSSSAASSADSSSTISSTGSSDSSATSSSSSSSSSGSSSSASSSSGSSSSSGGDATGYYASISDSLTGGLNGSLRTALSTLIKPKSYYSYKGTTSGKLGYELQYFDEDPSNSSNMYFFYINTSIKKEVANDQTGWNREHCWPQSLSGGLYGTSGGGADALHIRPTLAKTNSTRGNHKYGKASSGRALTIAFRGTTYDYGRLSGDIFEPLDEVKGDCARIVFYMYTCYFAARNTSITNCCESVARMVEWSKLDPPSEIERHRNEYCEKKSVQKNRNPFVDHPEWVDKVFAS